MAVVADDASVAVAVDAFPLFKVRFIPSPHRVTSFSTGEMEILDDVIEDEQRDVDVEEL